MPDDLVNLESHFAFGENWRSFAGGLDEATVVRSVESLRRLLPADEIAGRSFLDIGSGSGLSSLAALRLGAGRVCALDIDPDSVSTTRAVLTRFASDGDWTCDERSVFGLTPEDPGLFDIVHSWGVLHHTGDMWRAVDVAASLVAPGGTLVLALYRRTPACGAWTTAKRRYSRASRWVQRPVMGLYGTALLGAFALHGKNPVKVVREYSLQRGMSFWHDVHDWLGGYPYESASPAEVHAAAERLGMRVQREFLLPQTRGWFGSGCDEYVFVRI